MCAMLTMFLTVIPAQTKAVVGSDMGIPVCYNLQNTTIDVPAVILFAPLAEWGLLYMHRLEVNYNLTATEKPIPVFGKIKIEHYDPGWQSTVLISKNKNI